MTDVYRSRCRWCLHDDSWSCWSHGSQSLLINNSFLIGLTWMMSLCRAISSASVKTTCQLQRSDISMSSCDLININQWWSILNKAARADSGWQQDETTIRSRTTNHIVLMQQTVIILTRTINCKTAKLLILHSSRGVPKLAQKWVIFVKY